MRQSTGIHPLQGQQLEVDTQARHDAWNLRSGVAVSKGGKKPCLTMKHGALTHSLVVALEL